MKITRLFCCACIAVAAAAIKSNAQGPERERQYTQQREAAARAADERAHIESARTNNLPNGYGKSSGSSAGTGGNYDAVTKQMAEDIVAAFNSARSIRSPQLTAAQLRPSDEFVADQRFFDSLKLHANTHDLNALDKWEWFYQLRDFPQNGWKLPDRAPALAALGRLQAAAATAPYDSVLRGIVALREFPVAALDVLSILYQRFPEKKEEMEKAEFLYIMPMIFGGSYPELYLGMPHYPATVYEGSWGEAYRKCYPKSTDDVLDRVAYLDRKYPQLGPIAAGRCRPYLNFYKLIARRYVYTSKNKASPLSDEEKEEYYIKVLATRYPKRNSRKSSEEELKDIAARRIGEAGEWLGKHARKKVKNFSVEEWQAIAEGLELKYVAWAFRNPKHPEDYEEQYDNLAAAIKGGR